MTEEADKNSKTETGLDKNAIDTPGETAPAQPEPAAGPAPDSTCVPTAAEPEAVAANRQDPSRRLFSTLVETMRHIERCEKDKNIVFRHSDKTSLTCLFIAFGMEVGLFLLFMAQVSLRPLFIGLAVTADIFFGLAITWYVLLRFGVIRSFDSRQTLLTWQLMIGAGALFAFFTMNVAFVFFIFYNLSVGLPPPIPL